MCAACELNEHRLAFVAIFNFSSFDTTHKFSSLHIPYTLKRSRIPVHQTHNEHTVETFWIAKCFVQQRVCVHSTPYDITHHLIVYIKYIHAKKYTLHTLSRSVFILRANKNHSLSLLFITSLCSKVEIEEKNKNIDKQR